LITVSSIYSQELRFEGNLRPGDLAVGIAPGADEVTLGGKPLDVSEDGTFLLGFDRDDTGTYILRVRFGQGNVLLKKITLPEREYKIQRINRMKKKYVHTPKKQIERIRRESKIVDSVRSKIGEMKEPMYKSGFRRPVSGGYITGVFGSQRILNGVPKNAHNGLDIAKPRGTPIYAMADGVVRLAADTFYYAGNFILLDHGQGLTSVYIHMSEKSVAEGDTVKKGQKIGEVGSTGRSTGPHLHWGVKWFNKRIDPAGLLKINLREDVSS
jgi:murein DD-endopeptidase MepM/ murein hydrolase activator NlpD